MTGHWAGGAVWPAALIEATAGAMASAAPERSTSRRVNRVMSMMESLPEREGLW